MLLVFGDRIEYTYESILRNNLLLILFWVERDR